MLVRFRRTRLLVKEARGYFAGRVSEVAAARK
jgi:hypothetical protein